MKRPLTAAITLFVIISCCLIQLSSKNETAPTNLADNITTKSIRTNIRTASRVNTVNSSNSYQKNYAQAFKDFLADQTNEIAWQKAMKDVDRLSPSEAQKILKQLYKKELVSTPRYIMAIQLMSKLTSRWADEQPAESLDFIQKNTAPRFKIAFMSDALSSWATNDLRASLEWLHSQNDNIKEEGREKLLSSIHISAAKTDPISAIQSYLNRPLAKLNATTEAQLQAKRTIEQITFELYQASSTKEALTNLSKLVHSKQRDTTYAAYAMLVSETSPRQALDIISDIENVEIKSQALIKNLMSWVSDEPKAALGYIETIIEDETLDPLIIANVVTEWSITDNDAAAAWISSWEYSPAMDTAISTIAINYAHKKPQTAIKWLVAIQDPEQKKSALKTITKIFEKHHPERIQQLYPYPENTPINKSTHSD